MTTTPDTAPSRPDALALLQQDQASVATLLDAYKGLCDRPGVTLAEKHAVAQRLHLELTLGAMPQQEVLGPVLRAALQDPAVFRAQDASVWSLIAHLSMGEPGDSRFDARLMSLGGELVRHWAQDRREVLPRACGTALDLQALGDRMQARKGELMAEFDPPTDDEEDESDDPVGRPVSSSALHGEER
jgi:hypothetical protein